MPCLGGAARLDHVVVLAPHDVAVASAVHLPYATMPLCRYVATPLCRYATTPLCREARESVRVFRMRVRVVMAMQPSVQHGRVLV